MILARTGTGGSLDIPFTGGWRLSDLRRNCLGQHLSAGVRAFKSQSFSASCRALVSGLVIYGLCGGPPPVAKPQGLHIPQDRLLLCRTSHLRFLSISRRSRLPHYANLRTALPFGSAMVPSGPWSRCHRFICPLRAAASTGALLLSAPIFMSTNTNIGTNGWHFPACSGGL